MKKFTLFAAAAAVGLSVAGAQTWTTDDGTYTLKGCYPSAGAVRCDLGYIYTRSDSAAQSFKPGYYEVVGTDGKTYTAKQIAVGGNPMSTNVINQTYYKGISVPFSIIFDAPSSMTSFQVMALERVVVNNVPIRGATPTPAPAPIKPPTTGSTANYNAVLSNCKADAKGVLTCTAVLTPRR
ncbi:hypothetical protein [Deinococcus humi]|uniref:Uncharacterized protein n=1 Tax=Deinococcus humi TaxID=662880 RepID=A0A7W8K236_9DEIO|nr:hypothetical protein [Deinococcus humi]MBB5366168.1 hypothetical protein [Deinococcus humi]GGO40707.1 hypothetical protein GCM10008949_50490 [Deinococcus humi]